MKNFRFVLFAFCALAFSSAQGQALMTTGFSLAEYQESLVTGMPMRPIQVALPASLDHRLRIEPKFDQAQTVSPYIIGGSNASRSEFREHALVLITDGGTNIIGVCGGALIASNKVLTAAHCAQFSAGRYFVIPSFYSFNDQITASDLVRVSRVADHPGYRSSTSENDVAVLTLSSSASGSLVKVHVGDDEFVGETGTVIGAGLIRTNPATNPTVIQKVSAPIITNSQCNSIWSSLAGITPIRESMMCAGFRSDGRGSCSGDSGSPLYLTIKGQRVAVGTVSFGLTRCESNRGNQTYARLSKMTDFLKSESPNTRFVNTTENANVVMAPILGLLLDNNTETTASVTPLVNPDSFIPFPELPPISGSGTNIVIVARGNEKDTLIGNRTVTYTSTANRIVYQELGHDEVNFLVDIPVGTLELWIRTPQEVFPYDDLELKTYHPISEISVFGDNSLPGLLFTDNGHECKTEDGQFTISRMVKNDTHGYDVIEGSFEQVCASTGGKVRGRFRYDEQLGG
ncbi:serine protease [Arenicella sp. 4NH20-0111]|uniref:S1 family peptidase n=1 Tax=Arenicella sp. 4NH20-0111 TaxID=3127648 RepID=UPI00334267AA